MTDPRLEELHWCPRCQVELAVTAIVEHPELGEYLSCVCAHCGEQMHDTRGQGVARDFCWCDK